MILICNSDFSYGSHQYPAIYLLKIGTHTYVGSTKNLKQRLNRHLSRLKSNSHRNNYMRNAYNKHKSLEFFLLEKCCQSKLIVREQYYIDLLKPDLNFMEIVKKANVAPVGKRANEKVVHQYNLDSSYVASYPSVSEAARKTDINNRTIAFVCDPNKPAFKSAGGYLWSYMKETPKPYTNNSNKAVCKKIDMTTIDGKYLKSFSSIADCARYLKVPADKFDSACASISGVARGKGKQFKGYKFKYH